MDTFFSLLLLLIIIVLIVRKIISWSTRKNKSDPWSTNSGTWSNTSSKGYKEIIKLSPYIYERKEYIMTSYERQLFKRLEAISNEKYYVFPQVHLSSLLKHDVNNGQDWRAALSKIQRKSVDFVLVDKETLETAYAIELDDRTHDMSTSRWERDELVNEILFDTGIPLVRLRNIRSLTDEEIKSKIISAKQKLEAVS